MGVPTWKYEDVTAEMLRALGETLWFGPEGEERYEDTDLDDAIEHMLDACHPDVPATIEVAVMRPMPVKLHGDDILGGVLTVLDENYGDPDGIDRYEPTPAMKDAAHAFARVVEAEYRSFMCEHVATVVVDGPAAVKRIWPDEVSS